MGFWDIPSFKEMFVALCDGFVVGLFVVALIGLSNSLLTPLPLTEDGLRKHNAEVLGLGPKATWEEIEHAVNLNSKQSARYSLKGANIPNLSMQFKQQQNSWPSLESMDRG